MELASLKRIVGAALHGNGAHSTAFSADTHTTPAASASAGGHMEVADKRSLTVQSLGNITGAVAVDFNSGYLIEGTLTGNVTFSVTNAPANGGIVEFLLTQDATGGRTVTWMTGIEWPGDAAPTVTTTASTVNSFVGRYRSTGTKYLFLNPTNFVV